MVNLPIHAHAGAYHTTDDDWVLQQAAFESQLTGPMNLTEAIYEAYPGTEPVRTHCLIFTAKVTSLRANVP